MDKIEKIKKWVQKQMELYWEKLPDADDEHPTEMQLRDLGQYMAYESMESFLDTLSGEPVQKFNTDKLQEIAKPAAPHKKPTPEDRAKFMEELHEYAESKKPDKSLEEAAEISFDEAYALAEDYRDFLAKGLTENKPRPIGPHWFCEYAKKRFIVGAEWQKSQMPMPEDTVLFQKGVAEGRRLEKEEKDLGWISVKDRLPEKNGWYFTCVEMSGVPQCVGLSHFEMYSGQWDDDDDSVELVDYWMEIPELLKEDEK